MTTQAPQTPCSAPPLIATAWQRFRPPRPTWIGDAAYTYTQTYNATTGLLDTLQYPVSTSSYQLKLKYTYANGILQQISDATAGTVYWLADAANPRGQITQESQSRPG